MRCVLSLFFDALVNLITAVVPEDDPAVQWQTLVLLDEFIRKACRPNIPFKEPLLGLLAWARRRS